MTFKNRQELQRLNVEIKHDPVVMTRMKDKNRVMSSASSWRRSFIRREAELTGALSQSERKVCCLKSERGS